MARRRASLLFGILVAVGVTAGTLVVTAALQSGDPTGPSAPIDTIGEARAAWLERGSATYTFTITKQCFCTPEMSGPFVVVVRDGTTSVTRDGEPVDAIWLDGMPLTAEALFDFASEREGEKNFAVTFDQENGFPLSVYSDPIPEAVDDELGIVNGAGSGRLMPHERLEQSLR